jgi:DNA-binding transcriptional ArsR family regulator
VSAYEDVIEALGDGTRRRIFELVADQPRPVGELAAQLPVSRPAVSQHLRVLKEAGLVSEQRDGTRRVYRVEPDGVAELREYADRFWQQALANFKQAAEANQGQPRDFQRVDRSVQTDARMNRAS